MSSSASGTASQGRVLMRWFSGVPIASNPFIIRDVAIGLAVLWPLVFLFVLGAQPVLSRAAGGTGAQAGGGLAMALSTASYVAVGAAAVFLLAGAALFRNRFVMMYRLSEDALFVETMRAPLSVPARLPAMKPFPVEDLIDPPASVTKFIALRDIVRIVAHERYRMFELRGSKGPLARVYCPDGPTYAKAFACIADAMRIMKH